MCETTTRIEQVRYNAAEQCFEALVTLHTPTGGMRVACHFNAPLTAEFGEVADGLAQDALRRSTARDALKSRLPIVPPHRADPCPTFHALPFAA